MEGFACERFGGEVGNDRGGADVEPFGEDVGVEVGPQAVVFAPVGQFGGEDFFDAAFDAVPDFVCVVAGVGEVGVGIVLQVFEGEVGKVGAYAVQPVPEGFAGNQQEEASVYFLHAVFLKCRLGRRL